jgi:hypothetical protein
MAVQAGPDAWAAAPFDARLASEARQLVERLDGPQRLWLSGFLAGSTAAAQAGFTRAYNILEGFEGDLDDDRRRGTLGGWRRAGLPWVQS